MPSGYVGSQLPRPGASVAAASASAASAMHRWGVTPHQPSPKSRSIFGAHRPMGIERHGDRTARRQIEYCSCTVLVCEEVPIHNDGYALLGRCR